MSGVTKNQRNMRSTATGILSGNNQALQLRYLTTLYAIAGDQNSTIVFPFPIEIAHAFDRSDSPVQADLPGPE